MISNRIKVEKLYFSLKDGKSDLPCPYREGIGVGTDECSVCKFCRQWKIKAKEVCIVPRIEHYHIDDISGFIKCMYKGAKDDER